MTRAEEPLPLPEPVEPDWDAPDEAPSWVDQPLPAELREAA